MIRLKNLSDKKYEFRLTKNPVTNSAQSPNPLGMKKTLDNAKNKAERDNILNHPNYSESEIVYLRPGVNEFENEEHAEYFYMTLGNPEDGGSIPMGSGRKIDVVNKNIVIEVDEKGEEIKTNLFNKYRIQQGAQLYHTIDPELTKLKPV